MFVDRILSELDLLNAKLKGTPFENAIATLDLYAFQELMGKIIDEFDARLSALESARDHDDTRRHERAERTEVA